MKIIIVFYCAALLAVCSCDGLKNSMMYMRANIAYNQGNYGVAIELYKKLLEGKPNNADYHQRLGIAYFSNGQRYKVEEQALKLHRLNRDDLAKFLEDLLEQER